MDKCLFIARVLGECIEPASLINELGLRQSNRNYVVDDQQT
jgi:hypothetical protein